MSLNKSYLQKQVKIDLHVHTTASDGKYTPTQIVRSAYEKGIYYLAITDHDTIGGLEEAESAAKKMPIELLPGIELSTIYDNHEIHILGYYLQRNSRVLADTLMGLEEARRKRAYQMVEKINEMGYPITIEKILAKSTSKIIGRPHIALVLMDYGIVGSIREAFEKYLSPGCPAYVPRYRLSPSQAINLILQAGGVPVLAHPGLDFPYQQLSPCLVAGLKGIEVYHPRHTAQQQEFYLKTTKEFGLIQTGGSDFHGHDLVEWSSFGSMPVPLQTISELKRVRS